MNNRERLSDRVVDRTLTGHTNAAFSDVLRSVSSLTRTDRVSKFKIGITNDPEGRFRRAHAEHFDEMILVYRSHSIESVSEVEDSLIEWNKRICKNRVGGGGGHIGRRGPYYVYVVVKNRRMRRAIPVSSLDAVVGDWMNNLICAIADGVSSTAPAVSR